MADIIKVHTLGLSELVAAVAVPKLTKDVVAGVRAVTNDVHKEIASAVKKRYALQQSLDSVFIGNGASIRITGNVIKATLAYEYKANDLSMFPYSPLQVRGRYAVHYVNVLRGNTKVIHGKSGRGGFVPKGANTRKRGNGNNPWAGVIRMYERQGNKRLPLRVLFGPSLTQMASNVVTNNPSSGLSAILDNMDTLIASRIAL